MSTLLRKEKDGTLYKDAAVRAAFLDELEKRAAAPESSRRKGSKAPALSPGESNTSKPASAIHDESHARTNLASASGTSDAKRNVVSDIVRKYPALAQRGHVVKAAGVLGNLRTALKSPSVREHATELGGLGVLAVPGLDTLQAHARARFAKDRTPGGAEKRRLLGEGAHAALDVGGLGVLMGPELKHLVRR